MSLRALPIKRILLPLDLTCYGERAIAYAPGLARVTGATITLAHVAGDGYSVFEEMQENAGLGIEAHIDRAATVTTL